MKRYALIILVFVLLATAAARDQFDAWVDATSLPPLNAELSTEVLDRNGVLLRAYMVENGIWRLKVAPLDVDTRFLEMLVAYEDKRFFDHRGVDLQSLVRAAWQAVRYGRVVSGGSTLTMQVARLLENTGTGSWKGKLRQMRLALALERKLEKADILALYLMHAPYGANLEGIRAGALAWFGKEPKRLNPAQAALLVALPQSPEARRPDRNANAARSARNRVLQRTAHIISQNEARAARTSPVPRKKRRFPQRAAHLSDRAIAQDHNALVHRLTIDTRMQSAMEDLAARSVQQQDTRLSVAIIVADHDTGEILASVGSPRYNATDARLGFVDMTTAIRSPGSTLKPLIYALAMDQGLVHPETLIDDRPMVFGRYAPQNFDGRFRGQIRVRDALQLSLNIPVVALVDELGPARIIAALHRAGVPPEIPGGKAGLAIALGGLGLSLEDLVQLYAGLARGGESVKLNWRKSVDQPVLTQRITSEISAWQVNDILAGITPPQGALQDRLAYKTGTSYGHRDTWAIGYDGKSVIGVWLGRADGTPVPGVFGSDLAAPVLFEAFGLLTPALKPLPAPPRSTLLVSTAELPLPLRVFRSRNAVFANSADAPKLTFPPDGAAMSTNPADLVLKLNGGVPPFTVFTNNAPTATGEFVRQIRIPRPGRGFSSLSVVDANGHSDRIEIRFD